MISSELHGKKIEMEMNGQMQHSVKSEMEYRTQQQVDEANKKAVEENRCCDFQTTAVNCLGERTMTDTLKSFAHCSGPYGMRFAEKYDEASWFRARTEFLQKKVWELEAKMEKMRSIAIQLGDDGFCMRCGRWDGTETWDGKGVCKSKTIDGVVVCQECDDEMNECGTCNVSMKNEGGCDCQIVVCANCGIGGEKYKHHLCDDGELRCDECEEESEEESEEEEEICHYCKELVIEEDYPASMGGLKFTSFFGNPLCYACGQEQEDNAQVEEEEEDELNSAIDASGNALY